MRSDSVVSSRSLVVLGSFVGVTVLTSAYSLGRYCLTTWGGNPFGGV